MGRRAVWVAVVTAAVAWLLAALPGGAVSAPGVDAALSVGADSDVRRASAGVTSPRLSGQVLDALGRPAKTAVIEVVDARSPVTSLEIAGWTDGNGRFTLWPAPNYPFFLRVRDTFAAFAPQYFPAASLPSEAVPIQVLADTVLPPMVVGPGGTLAGTVSGSDGLPARHVGVVATNTVTTKVQAAGLTDVTGRYELRSIPPGRYSLTFDGGTSGSTFDYLDPEPIQATARAYRTTTVNVTLTRRPRAPVAGSVITGRVVDTAGRPVRDIAVGAAPLEEVTSDHSYVNYIATGVTDPNGVYRLHPSLPGSEGAQVLLKVGDYVGERNWPGSLRYDLEPGFVPGVRHFQDATVVTVPTGTLTLPDTTLSEMGGVSGHVLLPDGSSPRANGPADVAAYDETGKYVQSNTVQHNGRFYLYNLPAGTYRIWFGSSYDLQHDGGFVPNWWLGGSDFTSATPVTVTSGETVTDLDAVVVPLDPMLTGRLLDSTGQPVVGAEVDAFLDNPFDPNWLAQRFTDWDGRFAVKLEGGYQYKVKFGAPTDPRFPTFWFGGGTSYGTAGVLTATSGQQFVDLGDIPVAPAATAPTTAAPSQVASRTLASARYHGQRRGHRPRVVLGVSVGLTVGEGVAGGLVTVTERGRLVRQLTLIRGHARLVIKHPTPRRHTYVVCYLGDLTTMPSSTTATVRVRQPHPT